MLRHAVIVLICLLAPLNFVVIFQETKASDQVHFTSVIERIKITGNESIGPKLIFPDYEEIQDPEIAYSLLKSTAMETEVNVFRQVDAYDMSDQPYTNYYILLANKKTDFTKSFNLAVGTFLTPVETQNSDSYLATPLGIITQYSETVGIISDFGNDNVVRIFPLQKYFESGFAQGNYIIECYKPAQCDSFFELLAEKIGSVSSFPITSSSLKDSSEGFGISFIFSSFSILDVDANVLIWLILLMVGFMVLLYQFYEAKRLAIYRLSGWGIVRCWFQMFGKRILFFGVGSSIVTFLSALLVPMFNVDFLENLGVKLGINLLLLLVVSIAPMFYLYSVSISESLRNRRDVFAFSTINLIFKLVVAFLIIIFSVSCLNKIDTLSKQMTMFASWEKTTEYGIFYPDSIGEDETNDLGMPTYYEASAKDLYPILDQQGALYIETDEFTEASLEIDPNINYLKSIKCNPNYLNEFAILDENNDRIVIENTETDLILLVPEKYQNEYEKIVKHYTKDYSGIGEDVFGDPIPKYLQDQKTQVIWLNDDQNFFSFSSEVYPESGNTIKDAVIQVLTISNSIPSQRINGFNGGLNTPIKLLLDQQDPKSTYEKLLPNLTALDLEDNFKGIVSIQDQAISYNQLLTDDLYQNLFLWFLLLVAFVILSYQSSVLYFEHDFNRIVAKKLRGFSLPRRYSKFLAIFLGFWSLLFVIFAVLHALPELSINLADWNLNAWLSQLAQVYNTIPGSPIDIIGIVLGVYFLIETVLGFLFFSHIEKAHLSNQLKTSFQ